MEEENVKSIAEYLEVLNRRKWLLLVSFLIVGFLGFVLAMKLPPVYRSSATILIEDQQIPRSMVQTTITDFADKRIELIRQRVMTRDRILSIIQKHKVYLDERDELVPSELVKRFQEDAEIRLISADVRDPQRGGGKATIAFTISFGDKNPVLAQAVANELVSLFLDENTRVRAQRAAKTTEFLNTEADKLKAEIEAAEAKIMDYKAKYRNSLPEMLQTNLSALDRAKDSQKQAENDIRHLKDRITYLTESLQQADNEIPATKQGRVLTKAEQLQLLKSQYIQLSSRYTAKHPDAQRVKRQIQNLEPGFDGVDTQDESALRNELTQAEDELAILSEKYSETHPGVVKLQTRVSKLKEQLSDVINLDDLDPSIQESHQDSALKVSLTNQLRAAQHELENLINLKDDLKNDIQRLQNQIDETPLVEKDYLELLRMRQTSLNKYGELEAKYREARLAQTLEEEQKGEAFTLIEPPIAPDKPDKPDRKKIIILGFGAGLGMGLGLTVLLELLNEVIRGAKSLERLTGMQPIVVIPYIETPQDREQHRRRLKFIWIGIGIFLMAAIALIHFFVMPLDRVWAIVMFKIARL